MQARVRAMAREAEFAERGVNVIVANQPDLAIVRGAVGLKYSNVLWERIMPFYYGIATLMEFDPRKHRADIPAWLQEIILRCLEPEAAQRYPSAAHLAFDLANPGQVLITERGERLHGTPLRTHLRRWFRAAGMQYTPSPLPAQQIEDTPILMVAVPHADVSDATLYSLRQAVGRSLGIRPGARLACVTVISPSASSLTDSERSETTLHRQHMARLRQWAQGLDLAGHSVSYHVLEAGDVAHALVRYAASNHVSMMILGAATHGLQTQRFIATVPMRVARDAHCTVILVKQALPFAQLGQALDD
jgi:nucleotide-binding universal stress UspA family protein